MVGLDFFSLNTIFFAEYASLLPGVYLFENMIEEVEIPHSTGEILAKTLSSFGVVMREHKPSRNNS